MKRFLPYLLIFAGLSMVFPTQRNVSVNYLIGGAPKAFASAGGPMVLDGMDPVCHASYGESTDR